MSKEALAAKVIAVNRANEYAVKLYPQLRAVFEPLLGQQVVKVNGDLLAKVEKLVPSVPANVDLHVYRHRSAYSLAWTVKTCESIKGTHGCLYHEVTVYIGDLRGQVLERLNDPYEGRADYTAAEVEGNREAYRVAKKASDDAQSKLWPFGEYDR